MSRRRAIIKASVFLVVLLAAGVAAAVGFGLFRSHYRFEDESAAILKALSAGEAERVYEEAAFQFQEKQLIEHFVDLVDRMNKTFGKFEYIDGVDRSEHHKSLAGKTALVVYDVKFEKTMTQVTMSYVKGGDGDWRLLGLDASIPDHLAGIARGLESQYSRIKAPAAVIAMVPAIMEQLRDGEAESVVENASPPFQEGRTVKSLQKTLDSHRQELGDYVRVLATLSSAQSPDKTRARVDSLIEFEKTKTTASFDFLKVEGVWKLLHLKVAVPEPLLPAR